MNSRMDDLIYSWGYGPAPGLVSHANKLGISLKSKDFFSSYPAPPITQHRRQPTRSSEGFARRPPRSRVGSAHSSHGSHHSNEMTAPTLTYIHDVVVPLNSLATENSARSYSASHQPYPSSRYHAKLMSRASDYDSPNGTRMHTRTPNSRVQSAHRYNRPTSSPREHAPLSVTGAGRRDLPGSHQSIRYEQEQDDLAKCRTRKRTAEICPHRIDRKYYMTGATVRLAPKYYVEPEELTRLRELSRARKSETPQRRATSSHHGDQYIPDHVRSDDHVTPDSHVTTSEPETPKEAPPSRASLVDEEPLDAEGGGSQNDAGEPCGEEVEVEHQQQEQQDLDDPEQADESAELAERINGLDLDTQQEPNDQPDLDVGGAEENPEQNEQSPSHPDEAIVDS